MNQSTIKPEHQDINGQDLIKLKVQLLDQPVEGKTE